MQKQAVHHDRGVAEEKTQPMSTGIISELDLHYTAIKMGRYYSTTTCHIGTCQYTAQ